MRKLPGIKPVVLPEGVKVWAEIRRNEDGYGEFIVTHIEEQPSTIMRCNRCGCKLKILHCPICKREVKKPLISEEHEIIVTWEDDVGNITIFMGGKETLRKLPKSPHVKKKPGVVLV